MNTIILTAAVKPSQPVAINDPAERLQQYYQSIRRWIVESPMDRIIVVEGSGTPIVTDELRSLAGEHKKILEEQVMDLSGVVRQYGKGRGEAVMFDAVVPTLPDGAWFKCTGRLYVENVRECMEGSTPVAMQKGSDTPAHFSCDTRFFKCTREYYLRELASLTQLIDAGDNFIEKVYPAIGQLGAVPIIAGRGAHTNLPYDRPLVRGRKTIYVRRSSGSGNQLFQFAFGKALAIEMDADLYFDIDTSYTRHEQFILAFPNIIKHKPPPSGTPVHCFFAKSTPEEFEEMKRRIADGPDHAIICGHFQVHHHIVRHEAAIREALTIEPLPEFQDCIAVCVRRGDFVGTGLYIDLSPQWFTAAAEHVGGRISSPNRVVVFSNDPAWCRANLPWEVVSKDAWHDMRAIRSCAGVVFTNSTFHWWGAWLANVPTVCAAAINYQYPETFYDPRWVQMHNDGVVSIPVEPGGHIKSAIYGDDPGRFDVTNLINKLHARGLRHIRASNEIAGDPAPNVVKRLELEFADGRRLRVPENGIADIGDVFYGHHAGGTERRISLCIPHYSGPNYDRVGMLLQSFEHVMNDPRISEVIVNDDHSEDQPHEQTAALLKGFPKAKLFRNEQNLGPYRNRRMAIERAANPWVITLDNDNTVGPDFLDKIFGQEWHEDTILAPDFAKPIFDFRHFDGLVVTRSNVAFCAKETELFLAFINDGNYFVNRQRYLDAWDGSVDPATSDSEYFNYCWLAAGNQMKVVAGLEYFHRVHPQSYHRQNQHRAGNYHRMVQDKIAALEAVNA